MMAHVIINFKQSERWNEINRYRLQIIWIC